MTFRLPDQPGYVKVVLTAFLALLVGGYGFALVNIFAVHELADGRRGLSFNDLVATYHGLASRVRAEPQSRMLEMIRSKMRDKFDTEAQFRSLESWLLAGAAAEGWKRSGRPASGDPSPEEVVAVRCLRCHNAESGKKRDAPFGPDVLTTDLEMVQRFAKPTAAGENTRRIGLSDVNHLILVTHAHMLAMPVFTLIVAGLFFMTALSDRVKLLVGPAPMLALIVDFSSWWLARTSMVFVYLIVGAGAVFGMGLGIQIAAVVLSLWWGRRAQDNGADQAGQRGAHG